MAADVSLTTDQTLLHAASREVGGGGGERFSHDAGLSCAILSSLREKGNVGKGGGEGKEGGTEKEIRLLSFSVEGRFRRG